MLYWDVWNNIADLYLNILNSKKHLTFTITENKNYRKLPQVWLHYFIRNTFCEMTNILSTVPLEENSLRFGTWKEELLQQGMWDSEAQWKALLLSGRCSSASTRCCASYSSCVCQLCISKRMPGNCDPLFCGLGGYITLAWGRCVCAAFSFPLQIMDSSGVRPLSPSDCLLLC